MMDLKCKSCGYPLVVTPGAVVAKCEACGLINTLPSMDEDQKILRCNRANDYRQQCEFDQAAQLFEEILKEDAREPEAYWGLVLCKYGVQYVTDPKNGQRVPTCNRIQPTPITADVDYKKTLTYADASRLGVYKHQAETIDAIQKKIIEISSEEKPYDVFICYKELDTVTGQRTPDSLLAQELYRELTNYHLRVFFARITLQDKLGVEYEPYIYAALTSAPVMIHVTTSMSNSNAPWVKNEWSRYLALKNSGSDKMFTVAYKGLDPERALPREFSGKQASDLSRVGAFQDLAEWASRAVSRYKEKQGRGHEDEEALKITLKNAFRYLAAGNHSQAQSMFEACIASDKTCAEAYLGLVMAKRHYMNRMQLGSGLIPVTDDYNFNLAMQYANQDLKLELENAEAQIQANIRQKQEEERKKAEEAQRKKEQEQREKEEAERRVQEEKERKRQEELRRKKKAQKNKAIICAGIAACIALGIAYNELYTLVIGPANRYSDAKNLLQSNQYAEAYTKFKGLAADDYKDAAQMLDMVYQECLSDAKNLIQSGDYQGGLSALESMEGYASSYDTEDFYRIKYQAYLGLKEYGSAQECLEYLSDATEVQSAIHELSVQSVQNASVGSTVIMGQYEQDANTENGAEPIEWEVLDVQNGNAFVVSKKILAYMQFSDTSGATWKTSTARQWLNHDFYNVAFSEEEKNRIIEKEEESVESDTIFIERDYARKTTHVSSDKVTLLSADEVLQCFSDTSDLRPKSTETAEEQRQTFTNLSDNSWLLRSPFIVGSGNNARCSMAYYRWENTLTIDTLTWVQSSYFGILPAMWVKIAE